MGGLGCCRSFAETCTRIQSALQSKVFTGPADSEKDDLVRLSFNAIEVVYSVRPIQRFLFVAVYFDILSFWFLLLNFSHHGFLCVFIVGVLLHVQFAEGREQRQHIKVFTI